MKYYRISLRIISKLELLAYAASTATCRILNAEILGITQQWPLTSDCECACTFLQFPFPSHREKQWIDAYLRINITEQQQHQLTCLSAASYLCSCAMLNCLPCPSIGKVSDYEASTTGISHYLGYWLYEPHICLCGVNSDMHGSNPLSCHLRTWRFPRHDAIIDILKRALNAYSCSSVLVPVGGDGKRYYRVTIFAYTQSMCLMLHATGVNAHASSAQILSAILLGSAVKHTLKR